MAGRWYANGISLSQWAYNVRSRASGWRMAAKRGEDLVVPGRSGAKFNPDKPSDVGALSLEMWAVGANLDGSIPDNGDRAGAVRSNLDRLTRLFGDNNLIEIARTDDDDVDYGRQNLIPNPSFERALGDVVVRENRVVNSSAEYQKGTTLVRQNLVRNPSFEAAGRMMAYRVNLFPNPRMTSQGANRLVRTNLCINPSFEANLKGWYPNNRANVTRKRRDIGGRGPWVAHVECENAGGTAIKGGTAKVRPGRKYAVQVKCRNWAPEERTLSLAFQWYTGAGAVTWTVVDSVAMQTGGIQTLSAAATAPAGAKYLHLRLNMAGAEPGDVALWDEVCIEEVEGSSGSGGAYFDGTMPDRDGLRYRWNDASGLSVSEEFRTMPRGYTVAGDVLGGLSEKESRRGHQSCKVWVTGSNGINTGDRIIGNREQDSAKVGPNIRVSGSLAIALDTTEVDDATREVNLRMRCYDADGTNLGDAVTSSGGATVAETDATIDSSGWQTVTLNGAWTLPGTARVGLVLDAADYWSPGDAAYVDCFLLEKGTEAGDYFDGASKADDTFTFYWGGERHWSHSGAVGREGELWVTEQANGYQTVDEPRRGETTFRLFPRRQTYAGQRMRARTYSSHVRPGRAHTFSIYVRANRVRNVHAELVWSVPGQGKTTTTGASVATVTDEWVRVSVTGFCPDGASGAFAVITTDDSPDPADTVDLDCALWEICATVRKWFSGRSGEQYKWYGKPHTSRSIYWRSKATGWSAYGSAHPTLYRMSTVNSSDGDYCVIAVANEDGNAGVTVGGSAIKASQDVYSFAIDAYLFEPGDVQVGIVWKTANNEIISRSEDVVAHAGDTWVRAAITGTAPENASFAAGYAVALNVPADTETRWDAALFGFGGATDYKDGDNFSGWRWTGEKGLSSSAEYGEAVLYWHAWEGTLERSSAWASRGTYSGIFVVTDSGSPRISPHVPADWDDEQMRAAEGETFTFATRVKAREGCVVRPRLIAMTYDGYRYIEKETTVVGESLSLAAGQEGRVSVSGVPIGYGSGHTHVRAQVQVYAPNGGPADVGTGIWLDEAVAAYGESDKYIDGSMGWVKWTAGAHQSPSVVYGPARRCRAQVVAEMAPESMAGGTRAEFTVEMQIPDVYWEDTWVTEDDYPIVGGATSVLPLQRLRGMTAPIDDAIIEVHGPFRNMRLKDIGSGAWVQIDGHFRADQAVIINNKSWTVTDRRGRSLIGDVRHGGHPRLLPLTCQPDRLWPRLEVWADAIGADTFVRVKARRRYHIA